MPTPKAALTSEVTAKTPQLVGDSASEALEQTIRQRIVERAYALFEAAGSQQGNDQVHWLQVESEVWQRGLNIRESGSWLAINASLPDVLAEDVQIYLQPHRAIVQAIESNEAINTDSQTHGPAQQELLVVADLEVQVQPATASASFQEQTLTVMIKKRHPTDAPAQ
jgi:HSP20 family molecular chaperone IbpA